MRVFPQDGATRPVKDRAIVVHSGGVKAGCGTINYLPSVRGYVMVFDKGGNEIEVAGSFAGLEETQPDDFASGGYHIHTGTSCGDASSVGGHYWCGSLLAMLSFFLSPLSL